MHLDNFDKRSGDWKGSFRKLVTGRLYAWGQFRRTWKHNQHYGRIHEGNEYTPFDMVGMVQDAVVDVQCGYVWGFRGACVCGFGADGG